MKLAMWTTLFSIPATTAMATEDNLVSTIIYSVIGVLFALYHLFKNKISNIGLMNTYYMGYEYFPDWLKEVYEDYLSNQNQSEPQLEMRLRENMKRFGTKNLL
jgi:hypothetical protein